MNSVQIEVRPPDPETHCPSCGRFVGAYERCPYCLADMNQRISLKLIRRGSVIGAVLSLIIVWYASVRMEVPTLTIGSLTPTNNMAIVRIEGTVTDMRTMPQTDSFRLDLHDGTGHLVVNGFNALELFRGSLGNDFPRAGDKVAATGNIQLSETRGISMFLTSPGRYQLIDRPQPRPATLNQILTGSSNRSFIITVEVAKVRTFASGHTIEVKDESGALNLTLFTTESNQLPAQAAAALLVPGTKFSARVITSDYKGEIQLRLLDPSLNDAVAILSEGQPATAAPASSGAAPAASGAAPAADGGIL